MPNREKYLKMLPLNYLNNSDMYASLLIDTLYQLAYTLVDNYVQKERRKTHD